MKTMRRLGSTLAELAFWIRYSLVGVNGHRFSWRADYDAYICRDCGCPSVYWEEQPCGRGDHWGYNL